MSDQVERRKYIRIDMQSVVKCEEFSIPRDLSTQSDAVYKNISAGGILFESDKKYGVGDVLRLEISASGWEKYVSEFYKPDKLSISSPIIAVARVVRIEDIGNGKYDIGISLVGIDEEHRRALDKYIKAKIKGK